MTHESSSTELHHEIFGSILDREELTPYLLLPASNYQKALRQSARMMKNRGFDTVGDCELQESEEKRAAGYIDQSFDFISGWLLPLVKKQMVALSVLSSPNASLYQKNLDAIETIEARLGEAALKELIKEDPRHLFLMASSKRYPRLFYGYRGRDLNIREEWQQISCSILKMGSLIKSIEEDSQDINDFAHLGLFMTETNRSLNNLFDFDWENPSSIPNTESAQVAFVKVSTFIHKLKDSVSFDKQKRCLLFDSGDGVQVEIAEIKARLKSPQSMVTKLGKNLEGDSWGIQDILAITFVLKDKDDTLKLFHALQKQGVILQENTRSNTITQTLFDTPKSMTESVRRLMISLSKSAHDKTDGFEQDLFIHAQTFYEALSMNAEGNIHSSAGHKKFQCKLNFSLPIHRDKATRSIIIPGSDMYKHRNEINKITQQHTLGVELRISDEKSFNKSELTGDSHHDAYKFRQLIAVMNRIFQGTFNMPTECINQLRKDQSELF